MARLVLIAAVVMLVVWAPAAAHDEAEAPTLRPDVLSAGHEPALVAPHTHWSGWLTMRPGSNVTAAAFQICRVGASCFAPPMPAVRDGDTFRFNTSSYLAGGHPVDFQPGWHLGVEWVLTEGAGASARTALFPDGPAADDPACAGSAAFACQEQHYLAFRVVDESHGTPAAPLAVLIVALSLLSWRRRG
ncbi:MAG: hypothetical protein V4510_04305 [bacterium]